MSLSRSILAALAASGLVASAGVLAADAPPPSSPAAPVEDSPAAPASARPTFEYAQVRTTIAQGDTIGHAERGIFCFNGGDFSANDKIEGVLNLEAQFAFKRQAKAVDLPEFAREVTPFDTGEAKDPDYKIGGVVTKLDLHECSYPGHAKGQLSVDVKWDVFSAKQQRVVLSRTLHGTYTADSFIDITSSFAQEFESHVFDSTLHELFATPEFQALASGPVPAAPVPVAAAAASAATPAAH
jgi:hypothetical protein